jgi:hypothetical protein
MDPLPIYKPMFPPMSIAIELLPGASGIDTARISNLLPLASKAAYRYLL